MCILQHRRNQIVQNLNVPPPFNFHPFSKGLKTTRITRFSGFQIRVKNLIESVERKIENNFSTCDGIESGNLIKYPLDAFGKVLKASPTLKIPRLHRPNDLIFYAKRSTSFLITELFFLRPSLLSHLLFFLPFFGL